MFLAWCLDHSTTTYLDCLTKNLHQGVADLLELGGTFLVLHYPALLLALGLQEAGVRHLCLVLHQRAGGVGQQVRGDVQWTWLDAGSCRDQLETCGQQQDLSQEPG